MNRGLLGLTKAPFQARSNVEESSTALRISAWSASVRLSKSFDWVFFRALLYAGRALISAVTSFWTWAGGWRIVSESVPFFQAFTEEKGRERRRFETYINTFRARSETDTAAALGSTNTITVEDDATIRQLLVICPWPAHDWNLREKLIELRLTATDSELLIERLDGC